MQRWHPDDLTGHLIGKGDRWRVIRLNVLAEPGDPMGRREGEAVCPERYGREALFAAGRRT